MTELQTQLHDLVVERLALSGMMDEEREQIAEQTVDVLSKRVFVDLLPALSEEDRFVLGDMLSDGDLSDEEIDQFLRGTLDRYEDVVRASVDAFFDEMKAAINA